MSSTRRDVRATSRFFEDLDRQRRPERGPNGEPSTNDFQVFELIRIVDRFAVEFDDLQRLITDRDDYRILVMSGTLLAGVFRHWPARSRWRGRARSTRPSTESMGDHDFVLGRMKALDADANHDGLTPQPMVFFRGAFGGFVES